MPTPPRNTTIKGQPHYLAYITPEEGCVLKQRGGAGAPGPMGIPSYFDVGEGVGGYGSGQAGDATMGTGDPDAGRIDGGTYSDDQQDLSDPRQYAAAQRVFNQARGITATNPFGADNPFTKYLGIDPKNIKYDFPMHRGTVFKNGIISRGGVNMGIPAAQYYAQMGTPGQRIAANQFSKYMNPQNKPGMPGYNPEFPTAKEGQLRRGVQEQGYATTFGPVMEQARQQSLGEMAARGLMSLTPLGLAVGMMGTKEYGLPGQPGFEGFDPNNPRQGGGLLDTMLGGLSTSQAAQKAAQTADSLAAMFRNPATPAPKAPVSQVPLDENMYGIGDFDLGVTTYGAPVPASSITRTTTPRMDIDARLDALEDLQRSIRGSQRAYDRGDLLSSGPISGTQTVADATVGYDGSFFENVLDRLGITEPTYIERQPQIIERTPSGYIETQPRGTINQEPQSLRSLPGVMQLAGGKTYQPAYQGQTGVFRAGSGSGQTYYQGANPQGQSVLGTAAERARRAFDNLYGYFTS